MHGRFPRDARYEEEYTAALGAAYRRTKISEWDLDTAYLSLEAQQNSGRTGLPPTRIDALLPDRPRVRLRGGSARVVGDAPSP